MPGWYFLDSSALFKRYLEEQGTPKILEITQRDNRLVVSHLTMVEVASAGVRLAKGGNISEELLQQLLAAVDDDFRRLFNVLELAAPTMIRATDLVRVHGLKAADAIQLACALMAATGTQMNHPLVFVSSDNELNAAARQEGLAVLNPQEG